MAVFCGQEQTNKERPRRLSFRFSILSIFQSGSFVGILVGGTARKLVQHGHHHLLANASNRSIVWFSSRAHHLVHCVIIEQLNRCSSCIKLERIGLVGG